MPLYYLIRLIENHGLELLSYKKKNFLKYVILACKTYTVEKHPEVFFREGYLERGKEVIAYIDLSTMNIYVSLFHLERMTLEEIKKTAFHEVTHIFNARHDVFFYNRLSDALLVSWATEVNSGILLIDGNSELNITAGLQTTIVFETDCCNHPQCRDKTEVIRCSYCGKYYCIKHIKPTPPGLPKFKHLNEFNEWKQKHECHPCSDYYDFLRKIKETREKY